MRFVVTGASRGIGLELVRQLAARGETVEAACRAPERASALSGIAGAVRVHRCDIGDPASVRAFAAALGDAPVDVVINNAGVWGGEHQDLADLDLDEAARTFQVDALGPMRVTLALLPNVRRGTGKKLAHITSGMGSIGDNTSGGTYGYRMAKAALNMAARTLAMDLRPEGIVSIVINPGWVKTDMGGPRAPTAVADSARGVLRAIDGATLADTGEFLSWNGRRYPW